MEQVSDVEYRAEKLYKNSREKFGYLIREIVSNAIHAVIIKKALRDHDGYVPQVRFNVTTNKNSIEIEVQDNGDGFNQLNRNCFTHLDSRNVEKEKLKFHPKGQGRLSIVFFSDQARYSSVHLDGEGNFQSLSFEYPEKSASLFDVDNYVSSPADKGETGTALKVFIWKQQTLRRANTFFGRYGDAEKLRGWFIETFFPFFMENESLELQITYDGTALNITRKFIETNIRSVPFKVILDEHDGGESHFRVWMVASAASSKSRNQITCFARHLKAEIDGAKLEYEIDLSVSYEWLLTSEYFDDNVDQKGDKIEISQSAVGKIQDALNFALDSEFSDQISSNRNQSRRNISEASKKFHSLSVFIDNPKECKTKRILREADIVSSAIERKGRAEKAYWTSPDADSDEVGRLLNSSLQIYIDHRSKVLSRFQDLVRRFDENGDIKNESEDDVHDLFLRRGKTIKETEERAHLHNLWILDDKYTIFSETRGAASSKRGQNASDIYIWADDPEKTRELLILELKSTSTAHNAGDKYESMVAQVKRYASQFYRDPKKILNWEVDPSRILYSGFILARKSDINRELNSNNSGASPNKIPFLESSYFFNEKFSVGVSPTSEPVFKDIRIEMYSYEDVYQLAMARNSVFFKLLKEEFKLSEN